jgi:hypothetical protein
MKPPRGEVSEDVLQAWRDAVARLTWCSERVENGKNQSGGNPRMVSQVSLSSRCAKVGRATCCGLSRALRHAHSMQTKPLAFGKSVWPILAV